MALLVALERALLLQLLDLLLQVALALQRGVPVLHHLPQRVHLGAGVLVHFLFPGSWGGRRDKG